MVLYVCTVFDPIDLNYSGECYSADTAKSVFACAGPTGTYAWGRGGAVSVLYFARSLLSHIQTVTQIME